MFTAFPLLTVPVALYTVFAIIGLIGGDATSFTQGLTSELFNVPMPRGSHWSVAGGDLFVLMGLIALFFELIRATNTAKVAIVNHSLSMVLFIVCLIEFLLLPGFSTSTFFFIMMMTLLDVLAGFIVTIVSARKDLELTSDH